MKAKTKTQKTVTVLFTYIFKHICRVCFVVLSSDEETRYHTCFDNGKASCTCPAGQKHHICYHVTQLRPRYNAIVASKQQETPAAKPVATYIQDGQVHTVECIEGTLVDNVSATDEHHRVSRVDGIVTKWYPEYRDADGQWYRFPQPDGNRAVSFVVEGRAEQWLADRLAAVAEQAAEAKMDAFKAAMEVEETRASYMRHFYDEY